MQNKKDSRISLTTTVSKSHNLANRKQHSMTYNVSHIVLRIPIGKVADSFLNILSLIASRISIRKQGGILEINC